MRSSGAVRWAGTLALAGSLAAGPALAGCGVTGSNPTDIGNAYAPSPPPPVGAAPDPTTATTPEALIQDYLDAAVGGGDPAINHVKAFFTSKYRTLWQTPDKDTITIIRVMNQLTPGPGRRDKGTPVDVTYQVVGTLTDDGRVDDVALPQNHRMRFWVRGGEPAGELRVDGIESLDGTPPPTLMLRDDALNELMYREQPIYFWDNAKQVLVPDVRYVPNTTNKQLAAYQVVNWLVSGPAQSSARGALQALPLGIAQPSLPELRDRDSAIVIKLTAPAGGLSPESQGRLLLQIQASLRQYPYSVEVDLGNTPIAPVPPSEFQKYELSFDLPAVRKYDIADGVVAPVQDESVAHPANVPVLSSPQNRNVVSAALNRPGTAAAFVRKVAGVTTLAIVTMPAGAKDTATTVVRNLPSIPAKVGRPVWIPGADALLVPWGGELYRVTSAGNVSMIPVAGSVTGVSISPDGRRVAIVTSGRVLVGLLSVDNSSVSLVGQPDELVVDPRLFAAGVAWQSEQQLVIAGSSGGKPALWQVSADGVIAKDHSILMGDLVPTDVVAYPNIAVPTSDNVIVQCGENGPFRVLTLLAADGTHRPFFVA